MGYYAEITNGKVYRVLVTDDKWTPEETILWLKNNISSNNWIETKYDGSIRNKYAGIGDEYHADLDSFIHKPFNSWILNRSSKKYEPPIIKPDIIGEIDWLWSEKILGWELPKNNAGAAA